MSPYKLLVLHRQGNSGTEKLGARGHAGRDRAGICASSHRSPAGKTQERVKERRKSERFSGTLSLPSPGPTPAGPERGWRSWWLECHLRGHELWTMLFGVQPRPVSDSVSAEQSQPHGLSRTATQQTLGSGVRGQAWSDAPYTPPGELATA